MGKGLVNLPDGADFGPEHFGSEMSKNFGFSGSSEGGQGVPPVEPPPAMGGHAPQNFANGGNVHPDGHAVVKVDHGPHGTIMHHAHGGFSHHHPDGVVTHHGASGEPMASGAPAINGGHGPGEGTFVEKQMAAKAVGQHETHDHPGESPTDLNLARGGRTGLRARIPGTMKPKGTANHSPINNAPRNPSRSVTRRNEMPGGQLPYGVEPSSEPDVAGSEQNIPQLAKGGKVGSCY